MATSKRGELLATGGEEIMQTDGDCVGSGGTAKLEALSDELLVVKAKLAAALSASDSGVWEWDLATNELHWSGRCKTILGAIANCRTFDELAAVVPAHGGDPSRVIATVRKSIEETSSFSKDLRLRLTEGDLWVNLTAQIISGIDGTPIRLVGVIRDITGLKWHEAQQEITTEIAWQCNEATSSKGLVESISRYIKDVTECDSVGARLLDGEDYPFCSVVGKAGGKAAQTSLLTKTASGEVARDNYGVPILGCFCGAVISVGLDQYCQLGANITPGGSFWTNSRSDLQGSMGMIGEIAHSCQMHKHIECESIGIIPIIFQGGIIGVWHISYSRPRLLDEKKIMWIEHILMHVGITIAKLLSDERLEAASQQLLEAQEIAQLGSYSYDIRGNDWEDTGLMSRVLGLASRHAHHSIGFLYHVHPLDRTAWLQRFNSAIERHNPFDMEYRVAREDTGAESWVRTLGKITYDDKGPVSMAGTTQNIDAQKQAEASLKDYARRVVEMEESFRKELAVEIHDEIGRDLSAVGIHLAVIKSDLPEDVSNTVTERLAASESLVKGITRTVRNIMVGLRPPVLDDFGLLAALEWYAEHISRLSGVKVVIVSETVFPRLVQRKEDSLFRIAQEAIANAIKHSGAKTVTVNLIHRGETFGMGIIDKGVGYKPQPASHEREGHGWGMRIMRERADLIGGVFYVISSPDSGTVVSVVLPLGSDSLRDQSSHSDPTQLSATTIPEELFRLG